MWIVSIRETFTGDQLAYWRADALPDVQALQAFFAPRAVRVVQYRFLPAC